MCRFKFQHISTVNLSGAVIPQFVFQLWKKKYKTMTMTFPMMTIKQETIWFFNPRNTAKSNHNVVMALCKSSIHSFIFSSCNCSFVYPTICLCFIFKITKERPNLNHSRNWCKALGGFHHVQVCHSIDMTRCLYACHFIW